MASPFVTDRIPVALVQGDDLGVGKSGKVKAGLLERFSRGHYRFAQRLVVLDLANEFEVSRQPIMAALTELKGDGFVLITPQVGCVASSPGKEEIGDFFSVFAKMEGRMAGLAAQRSTSAQATDLVELQKQIDASSAKPGHHNLEGITHFHRLIRHMASSPVVASRVGKFWFMANYILRNGSQDYPLDVQAVGRTERAQIVDAILRKDAVRAEQLMELHVLEKPRRVQLL